MNKLAAPYPIGIRLFCIAFASAAAVSGCAVGPNFHRPEAPAATDYVANSAAMPAGDAPNAVLGKGPDLQWWTAFKAPALDAMVKQAVAHNYSLAASNATLERVRAQLAAAKADSLPKIDINARADQQKVNLAAFGFDEPNPEFVLYTVGGGVSYDLDLFGARRRGIEESAAKAAAQLRQTEAAHLTLAGQVVNQTLLIAGLGAQIDAVQSLLQEDEKNVDLAEKRRRAGQGTELEVLKAQSQLAADRGDLPPLLQQRVEARHLLAVLIGESPASANIADLDLKDFVLPEQIPVALPSALAHQRPDILQAEAELHAATAAVGVATAQLYPDITIGATATQGSPDLDTLFNGAFRGYDLFAGLTAPVFHGGALRAEKRAALADAKAAEAIYKQTVLEAFRQIANLLEALKNDATAVNDEQKSVEIAGRSLHLSRRSYEVGNSGLLEVLDAERLYQRSLSGLAAAKSQQYIDVARLYVATAGGWISDAAPEELSNTAQD